MRVFLITVLASLAHAKPQYSYLNPSHQQLSVLYGRPNEEAAQVFALRTKSMGASYTGNASSARGSFGGNFGFSSTSSGAAGEGTLVQKHIYVHVAPPEPEEFRPQLPPAGQATKHYKIIFIKAPSYPSYQQQILQAQAQNEEKTLVYVLVKQPDTVADIALPTVAPTPPSKPEVYFIRYKAAKSQVAGGGGAAAQLTGSGTALGVGASLNLASSSSASSQFNLNTVGSSASSSTVGQAASVYGPPEKSGPY